MRESDRRAVKGANVAKDEVEAAAAAATVIAAEATAIAAEEIGTATKCSAVASALSTLRIRVAHPEPGRAMGVVFGCFPLPSKTQGVPPKYVDQSQD
jgi:hypothetical protein